MNKFRCVTTKHVQDCAVWEHERCTCLPPIGKASRRKKRPTQRMLRVRRKVIARDGGRCRYCGVVPDVIEVDHVWPRFLGGENTMSNLVTACRACNQAKGAATDWLPIPIDLMPNQAHLDSL